MRGRIKNIAIVISLFNSISCFSQNTDAAKAFQKEGVGKYNLGDYKGSIISYNAGLAADSSYFELYVSRGISKTKINDLNGAMNDYNKSIEINHANYTAYYNRANLKMNLKKYQDALNDYDSSIKYMQIQNLNWSSRLVSDSYSARGGCYTMLGEMDNALADAMLAIKSAPDYGRGYLVRGSVYALSSQLKKACTDFQKAVDLGFEPAQEILSKLCNN